MSIDKAILYGKEKRKPYYGGGACDKTCRPNGGCPWCKGNRMHRDSIKRESANDAIREFVAIADHGMFICSSCGVAALETQRCQITGECIYC